MTRNPREGCVRGQMVLLSVRVSLPFEGALKVQLISMWKAQRKCVRNTGSKQDFFK